MIVFDCVYYHSSRLIASCHSVLDGRVQLCSVIIWLMTTIIESNGCWIHGAIILKLDACQDCCSWWPCSIAFNRVQYSSDSWRQFEITVVLDDRVSSRSVLVWWWWNRVLVMVVVLDDRVQLRSVLVWLMTTTMESGRSLSGEYEIRFLEGLDRWKFSVSLRNLFPTRVRL